MPWIKRKQVMGKKVKIAGVPHIPTTHDKNLGDLIEESDIVAIEGCRDFPPLYESVREGLLAAFLGKEGRERIKKNETPLTSLDPELDSGIGKIVLEMLSKAPVPLLLLGALETVTPNLLTALLCSNLPVFAAYFSLSPNKFVDNKYYWKYVEAESYLLSALMIPKPSKRDVGMAYGIERLAEEGYDDILSVIGEAHAPRIAKLLDNPEELKRKFEKYRRDFVKRGLGIYEPKELKEIEFIVY